MNERAKKMVIDPNMINGGLMAILSGLIAWTYKRLVGRVDVIEKNYVTKSQLDKTHEKLDKLNDKFDTKTDSITKIFIDEHQKTRDAAVVESKSITKIVNDALLEMAKK